MVTSAVIYLLVGLIGTFGIANLCLNVVMLFLDKVLWENQ